MMTTEIDHAQPLKRKMVDSPGNGVSPPTHETYSRIRKKSKPDKVTQLTRTVNTAQPPLSKTLAKTFHALGVDTWLVGSLNAMAITQPTTIQTMCIPQILKGKDCIGGSRTGSGKTIAFTVPILQQWARDPFGVFALILTPTRYFRHIYLLRRMILMSIRELALQIYEQVRAISASLSLKAILVTGGLDMREQAIALSKRPHVVIATPGRLADHINNSGEDSVCGLRRVRFVVLDEADRLLAPGHGSMLPDVDTCLDVLPSPSERQTCLFTATVTPEVRALKELPRGPDRLPVFVCEVDAEDLAIPSTLQQRYMQIPVTHKEHYLHILLSTPANTSKSTIIFCNRTKTATVMEHMLRLLEHRVTSLHSGLSQSQRIANLARFRAKAARILIASDVASRGLDIPEVALVVNYDIPRDPDDYIHRVGRTARAGRRGESVTLVGQRDVELLLAIENRVGQKMASYEEEGINIEKRVINDALKSVSEKKREALLQIEDNRDVTGKRRTGMLKLGKTGR